MSCVALTKAVVRAAPFQFTVEPLTKFVPVTVSVSPVALQKGVEACDVVDADIEVTVGAGPCGAPIVKKTTLESSVVVVLFVFDVAEVDEPGICTAI